MAIRFSGRPLKGSDIRNVENSLRNSGLKRELYRKIQRGDSPRSMNQVLRQAGYHLNRHQLSGYIGSQFSPKTFNKYTNRIVERYGAGSLISAQSYQAAGFKGEYHARVRIRHKNGTIEYRTVVIRKSRYDSAHEALHDLQDILPELLAGYAIEENDSIEIAEFKPY